MDQTTLLYLRRIIFSFNFTLPIPIRYVSTQYALICLYWHLIKTKKTVTTGTLNQYQTREVTVHFCGPATGAKSCEFMQSAIHVVCWMFHAAGLHWCCSPLIRLSTWCLNDPFHLPYFISCLPSYNSPHSSINILLIISCLFHTCSRLAVEMLQSPQHPTFDTVPAS